MGYKKIEVAGGSIIIKEKDKTKKTIKCFSCKHYNKDWDVCMLQNMDFCLCANNWDEIFYHCPLGGKIK